MDSTVDLCRHCVYFIIPCFPSPNLFFNMSARPGPARHALLQELPVSKFAYIRGSPVFVSDFTWKSSSQGAIVRPLEVNL